MGLAWLGLVCTELSDLSWLSCLILSCSYLAREISLRKRTRGCTDKVTEHLDLRVCQLLHYSTINTKVLAVCAVISMGAQQYLLPGLLVEQVPVLTCVLLKRKKKSSDCTRFQLANKV